MWRPRNFDALRSARFCHHVTDRAATSPATSMQMTANELSLACEKCGGTAATIRLIEGPWAKHSLAVTGFIGEMTIAAIGDRPVDLGMFQQIVRLSQGDLRQLHQLDPDIFERTSRTGVTAQLPSPEERARFEYLIAKLYARQGNSDHALQFLRRAMEEGYPGINDVYKDSDFEGLRKDNRFAQLMASKPPAIPE